MKWVTCVDGSLNVREAGRPEGLAGAADDSADGFAGALVPRAVHEFLFDPHADAPPLLPALAGVRAATGIDPHSCGAVTDERDATVCVKQTRFSGPVRDGATADHRPAEAGPPHANSRLVGASGPATVRTTAVVWFDPHGTLYPPALAAMGVPLDRLYVLRVRPAEVAAVAVDCLRCPGVAVVVAPLPAGLSRVEARRLQLAAEHGGGVGLVLRELGRGGDVYAAATRWRVTAAPGDARTQRWAVRLIHGHVPGRSIGEPFWLETTRAATDGPLVPVHPPTPLADHAPPAPSAATPG